MGNSKAALRWYQILLTKLSGGSGGKGPTDPNILARMGAIYARVTIFTFKIGLIKLS